MKLPRVSGREVVCALLKEGFFIRNQRGSHAQLLGEVNGLKRLVTVPLHGNTDVKNHRQSLTSAHSTPMA
ncbi:addiction module toxin, HicA family [Candidatus Woesearchaeota archaeon]|nr:MAG: addiction module toxin, HicA family [Candidatus Woesearchaeota archaeon]